jgi:hypothetical protein
MPRSKPTGEYASRREAILALTSMGYSQTETGKQIGVTRRYVSAVLGRERRECIPGEAAPLLLPEAQRRGVTVHELARRLLLIVATQGLVGAVLDDTSYAEAAE